MCSDADGLGFWRGRLNSCKLVVAPMVEQSELAWRLLCRSYGAELCYTPMLHANLFVKDATYRKENFTTCPEDRPLIVQFCANQPDSLLEAALLVEDRCDAVDLNLGCPQNIAKRGFYGAFLQDQWELVGEMVSKCAKNLRIPITCKIRIFKDMEKTINYAKMLEKAGCQLLTVHGRERDQKGVTTGVASWDHIKAVKTAVNIPVFANGNIQTHDDIERCLGYTGADGVMTAEGNLHNPAIFRANCYPDVCLVARDLQRHPSVRQLLATARNLDDMVKFIDDADDLCSDDRLLLASGRFLAEDNHFRIPYWLCQPYYRRETADPSNGAKPAVSTVLLQSVTIISFSRGPVSESTSESTLTRKRPLEDADNPPTEKLSKNKQRKLIRHPNKNFSPKVHHLPLCALCSHIGSPNCDSKLCKVCCRQRCRSERTGCTGHRFDYVDGKIRRVQRSK